MRHVVELRTDGQAGYEPGQEIKADIFAPGDHADVIGVSKGHGFAGVMKRHGFKGQSSSHGTEKKHRSPGSIGAAPLRHACSRAFAWPARWSTTA
jgi:large subunit ribosomal protein L3